MVVSTVTIGPKVTWWHFSSLICCNLNLFLIFFREKLEAFLVHAMESDLVSDGALAQDLNQASSFWHIREVCNLTITSVKHETFR